MMVLMLFKEGFSSLTSKEAPVKSINEKSFLYSAYKCHLISVDNYFNCC